VRKAGDLLASSEMALDADLVALFRCPRCHGALVESREPLGFGCEACRLLYPVEDDLPTFLVEEARPWPAPARGTT